MRENDAEGPAKQHRSSTSTLEEEMGPVSRAVEASEKSGCERGAPKGARHRPRLTPPPPALRRIEIY